MSEEKEQNRFNDLVVGLATSAVAVLGQVEELIESGRASGAEGEEAPLSVTERKKRVSDGLAGARQLIDMLGALEERTRGNLNAEEQELLQTALSELRVRHVSLSNRPVREVEAE